MTRTGDRADGGVRPYIRQWRRTGRPRGLRYFSLFGGVQNLNHGTDSKFIPGTIFEV